MSAFSNYELSPNSKLDQTYTKKAIEEFQRYVRAEEVRFLMLKSSFELARKSIYEKKRERYEETIKQHNKFTKKHPASKFANEAAQIIQNTENELKKLKA